MIYPVCAAKRGVTPMTHGIDAAQHVAAGAALTEVQTDLLTEAGIGVVYTAIGLGLLTLFERESRRRATLGVA